MSDMTRAEAIKIIRKEYKCVDRDCDIERSCGKCDLMMPSKEPILEAYNMAIKALDQEPKTGHWIMSTDGYYRPICDKCGAHPWKGYIPTVEEVTGVFKYCPNCGAKMEGEQE